MKVKTPLKSKYEVKPLVEAGADEFYCGVNYKGIPTGMKTSEVNVKNLKELKEIVQISSDYGVPVSLTLNRPGYSDHKMVAYVAEKAASFGVASFIIRDETVMDILNKLGMGVDMHVSCLSPCFNTESIRFYKEIGAKRITLPRQLTIKEIENLTKKIKGIDLEVMIYNGRCKNDNGLCQFNHPLRQNHAILSKIYKYRLRYFMKSGKLKDTKTAMKMYRYTTNHLTHKTIRPCDRAYAIKLSGTFNVKHNLHLNVLHNYFYKSIVTACGLCSLYAFNKAGIKSVKIVGRKYPLIKKLYDTVLVKKSIGLLKNCAERNQFENCVKQLQYKFTKDNLCGKLNCYYY